MNHRRINGIIREAEREVLDTAGHDIDCRIAYLELGIAARKVLAAHLVEEMRRRQPTPRRVR